MKNIALFLAVLCLSGCGGSDSDDAPQGYLLTAFDVTGTSADEAGVAPIDPFVNGGDFSVSWAVQDSGSLFTVAMAVSDDAVASPDDESFYARTCGGVTPGCPEAVTYTRTCNFNNSNILVCADQPEDSKDLTDYLPGIPFSGYIVIETCVITGFACSSESHPVRFD